MTDQADAVARIKASTKALITPSEAAKVLQCTPYALNRMAMEDSLPFKSFFVGNRLKIPRIPFLKYLGYDN